MTLYRRKLVGHLLHVIDLNGVKAPEWLILSDFGGGGGGGKAQRINLNARL